MFLFTFVGFCCWCVSSFLLGSVVFVHPYCFCLFCLMSVPLGAFSKAKTDTRSWQTRVHLNLWCFLSLNYSKPQCCLGEGTCTCYFWAIAIALDGTCGSTHILHSAIHVDNRSTPTNCRNLCPRVMRLWGFFNCFIKGLALRVIKAIPKRQEKNAKRNSELEPPPNKSWRISNKNSRASWRCPNSRGGPWAQNPISVLFVWDGGQWATLGW